MTTIILVLQGKKHIQVEQDVLKKTLQLNETKRKRINYLKDINHPITKVSV